ncbi:partial Protein-L-isoaspartate O-methyltransferase, partial [Rhodocyclaceae bacterium]
SGYLAALLAAHADHVWSVEIVPELAAKARENLERQHIANVTVETGDGMAGLPAHASFDVIVVSGGVAAVPRGLLDQLKVGGRLFAIVGTAPSMTAQVVTRATEDGFRTVGLFEVEAALLRDGSAKQRFVF